MPWMSTNFTVLEAPAGCRAGLRGRPLAAWKPAFDPARSQLRLYLSNVDHPAIEEISVCYRIAGSKVWERSGGPVVCHSRALAQLSSEKGRDLEAEAEDMQGMLCSSVGAV